MVSRVPGVSGGGPPRCVVPRADRTCGTHPQGGTLTNVEHGLSAGDGTSAGRPTA